MSSREDGKRPDKSTIVVRHGAIPDLSATHPQQRARKRPHDSIRKEKHKVDYLSTSRSDNS
jgi:hypothetical protein